MTAEPWDWQTDLNRAVKSYASGRPVVVLSTEGTLLHGSQTLEMIISLKLPLEVVVVRHVPQDLYEATDWPAILEAARQVFMRTKWPAAESEGSAPSRSNGRISA